MSIEANFDGLVGPTHNYSGLSFGNLASQHNSKCIANPKQAALQGLDKMYYLHKLGLVQGVIPPHARPNLTLLRTMGFSGSDAQVLKKAAFIAPELLASVYSASAMWVANAATVSPSSDTNDGRVHFTVANLHNQFHRSLECEQTQTTLAAIFSDSRYFAHHTPLPQHKFFGDEGAANHNRFAADYSKPGIELFVYNKNVIETEKPYPRLNNSHPLFPARQSLEASLAIARKHGLPEDKTLFFRQTTDSLNAGVFHNDVIAVGNLDVFLCHELAYDNQSILLKKLKNMCLNQGFDLNIIEVPQKMVTLKDAVSSYLFNSQIVIDQYNNRHLILPQECEENRSIYNFIHANLIDEGFTIHYLNLKQSMKNGGGPACLRLRVVLNKNELAAVNQSCLLNEKLYQELKLWINKHYRDRLSELDFEDPNLIIESHNALDELTHLLNLGPIYPFQK